MLVSSPVLLINSSAASPPLVRGRVRLRVRVGVRVRVRVGVRVRVRAPDPNPNPNQAMADVLLLCGFLLGVVCEVHC